MATNDGGPAFPHLHTDLYDEDGRDLPNGQTFTTAPGMSLRDYFAGQALMLAGIAASSIFARTGKVDVNGETAALTAYRLADAMLAAREAK
jgi:hypothetical protein